VLPGQQALLDLKVQLDHKVPLALKVQQDQMALQVLKVSKVYKACKATKVCKGQLDPRACKGRLVPRVSLDLKVQLDQQVPTQP
jgi:hypothetical protein